MHERILYENYTIEEVDALSCLLKHKKKKDKSIFPLINIFKDIHILGGYKSILDDKLMLDSMSDLMCNLQDHNKRN